MFEKFLKDPNFLANLFNTMRDGLMLLDFNGNIVYINKAAEKLTGYSCEEVIGKKCTALDTDTCTILNEDGKQKNCELFRQGAVNNRRCRITTRDGRSVYILKNASLLRDKNGATLGAMESLTDITSLCVKELELEELKQELREDYWFLGLLGRSVAMKRLYEQIRNAAASEAPVLIYGESGTGKELVANAVHMLSRRKDGPFIKLNCASLNEHLLESEIFGHRKGSFTGAVTDRMGRFEAAHNGSLLLDELGDMPTLMQAKLLRTLEEKVVERVGDHRPIAVDVRLVSATNSDLGRLISEGRFREDLFYRVNSIPITVPSLRNRAEDIPMLALHYIKKISHANNRNIRSIEPKAMEIIQKYGWPGNVRQLISALEHSAITTKGDTIHAADLPDYVAHKTESGAREGACDLEQTRAVLALYKGNRTLAAKHLGVSRVTLWKRLKGLGIA
jgi:two-component system, NtrC family, response regulator HydG